MADYDIRPLQLKILDILSAFDNVCREHGLQYYLCAGTMLGAIRHGGFIPWDDDADVNMPRKDYDILVQHAKEWIPKPYEINSIEENDSFTGTYAKFIDGSTTIVERYDYNSVGGVYLDVFPLDETYNSLFLARCKHLRYRILNKLAYFCNRNPYKHGKGPSSWIPRMVQALTTNAKLQKRACRIMRSGSYTGSHLLCVYDFKHAIVPKTVVGKPTPVMFEGKEFYGVEHPDEYLKLLYGDYMKLPDEEHRKQHNFYYLNYDLPYSEYVDDRSFVKDLKE